MVTETKIKEHAVTIASGDVRLSCDIRLPEDARGVVLFAHGSGSGRHSPRNQAVAHALTNNGFATMLLDLLTEAEEEIDNYTLQMRFDIELLARRLIDATDWAGENKDTAGLPVGYFGASTGAAAALVAAAERPELVRAIVSRGGRPDLAGDALSKVKAPTLFIVGGRDFPVIDLNWSAIAQLRVEKDLVVVPDATHLFEESGALQQVAQLALEWFGKYVVRVRED